MNIVAISCLGADHRHALRGLHRSYPLTAILQPVAPAPRPQRSRGARLLRCLRQPVATLRQRAHDWHYERFFVRQEREIAAALGEDREAEDWQAPVHAIPRNELHSAATLELLTTYRPDLIVTSGCPLLKPSIFALPRLGTINLHWGIAPEYRGEHTLFWPLYYNDAARLGVTIHQIDASIDGGPMLAQGWPELEAVDTETSVTVKAARLAADLLPRVVAEIERRDAIVGTRPSSRGRLFTRLGRRWRHDAWLACRRWLGLATVPSLPARESLLIGTSEASGPADMEAGCRAAGRRFGETIERSEMRSFS